MTWAPWDVSTGAGVTGEPPLPRSGHTAVACKNLMLVYGGWSTTGEFNDLLSFDTETLAWAVVNAGTFGPKRWNHAAVSVVAVPFWQIFMYGGSGSGGEDMRADKDKGTYLQDMVILNTGQMTMSDVAKPDAGSYGAVGGTTPRARADAAMVYDAQSKRLIVFGGCVLRDDHRARAPRRAAPRAHCCADCPRACAHAHAPRFPPASIVSCVRVRVSCA